MQIAHRELKQALLPNQIVFCLVDTLPIQLEGRGLSKELFPGPRQERYWLAWSEDLGVWVDRDGLHVEVMLRNTQEAKMHEASLVNFMTASVLGLCLNLQHRVAIHANSIALLEQAIAFGGVSGRGKSTLTAYCLSRGATLVTDDVLTVDGSGYALPGYSRIKLLPETAKQFGLTFETAHYKIHCCPEQLGGSSMQVALPLRTIYLLEQSENGKIEIKDAPNSEAFVELIAHSYYARYLIGQDPALLDAYADLIKQVPVRRLYYPRDFAALPEVYAFLLEQTRDPQ